MGKSTISTGSCSIAIYIYIKLPEGIHKGCVIWIHMEAMEAMVHDDLP